MMIDVKEYGRALFMITEEDSVSDTLLSQVKTAESVLKANPDYAKLIDSPALMGSERIELIDKAFGSLDERLLNLIKILAEKRELRAFCNVAKAYYGFYDKSRGIERVEAISAVPLTNEQVAALEQKLRQKEGKTFIVSNTVDPSVLGGVKLRYSTIQLDGSLKTRLDKIEKALKTTVI